MRKLSLAALLCVLATLQARAEDAPSAPTPPAASGATPAYPLKSENFKDIEEGHEILNNSGKVVGYSESDEAENIEPRSLEDIFVALKATPQVFLNEHVNPAATWYALMTKPASYHGEIVKLTGTFQMVVDRELSPPLAGVTKYWKGQVAGAGGTVTTFISLEPAPAEFEVGRAVNIYGIFMKRYVYHNRSPGDKGTWTPLVICRTLERATDFERSGSNWMFGPVGIGGLVLLVAAAIFLWMRASNKGRVVRMARAIPGKPGAPTPPAPPSPPTPPAGGDSPSSITGKAG